MSDEPRLSSEDLAAEAGTALPNKEVISLLDLNIDLDAALDLAAPIDLAVAANANVAAPINAAVSANVLSIGSRRRAPRRCWTATCSTSTPISASTPTSRRRSPARWLPTPTWSSTRPCPPTLRSALSSSAALADQDVAINQHLDDVTAEANADQTSDIYAELRSDRGFHRRNGARVDDNSLIKGVTSGRHAR